MAWPNAHALSVFWIISRWLVIPNGKSYGNRCHKVLSREQEDKHLYMIGTSVVCIPKYFWSEIDCLWMQLHEQRKLTAPPGQFLVGEEADCSFGTRTSSVLSKPIPLILFPCFPARPVATGKWIHSNGLVFPLNVNVCSWDLHSEADLQGLDSIWRLHGRTEKERYLWKRL